MLKDSPNEPVARQVKGNHMQCRTEPMLGRRGKRGRVGRRSPQGSPEKPSHPPSAKGFRAPRLGNYPTEFSCRGYYSSKGRTASGLGSSTRVVQCTEVSKGEAFFFPPPSHYSQLCSDTPSHNDLQTSLLTYKAAQGGYSRHKEFDGPTRDRSAR